MAPGIGGNGVGGSRHTGTVPKTKSHNESCREYNGIPRRDYQHLRHIPNNLASLEWQPASEPLPVRVRTRKESNTSASRFSDSMDMGEENLVTQDNIWYNHGGQRGQMYFSDDDEGGWTENRCKSNNVELVDKAQVVSRLHQICDYINQTVNMMDTLKTSGGQRNMVQLEKLGSMLEGLRNSEMNLLKVYDRLYNQPEGATEHFQQQGLEMPRERENNPVPGVPKSSDLAQRNELKKRVQVTELKLQELHEQQAALKALRQRAQEQLNEARATQAAVLSAHGANQQSGNMIQDRLQNLRFLDTRDHMVQLVGLDGAEVDSAEDQNKLDDLQAKKQHMDQLLAQISHLNGADVMIDEEYERDVEKVAELNSMRETLALLQNNFPVQQVTCTPLAQSRPIKTEPRTPAEKSNTAADHFLQAKTYQLQEAKSKLQQLQEILQTVEELRENGQPIPESILQLMAVNDTESTVATHQDRSDLSSQEVNVTGPECVMAPEHGFRPLRRLNHQPPANAAKHNNQEMKFGTKVQLEELMQCQDVNLPMPLQSSSVQENSITTGTWGGSTQGTLDDSYNPQEFAAGDGNETASVKNMTNGPQPHNRWRKPPTGSGASQCSWPPSSYLPQEHPLPPSVRQPDNLWVVQQITQLQSQLQQMSTLYKNFVEKQHNWSPPTPWIAPTNISAPLGPYCQYLTTASQWQQQQLLVHSLNQCCQLIWHHQRELMALKEALRELQQSPQELPLQPVSCDFPVPSPSASNLTRRPLKPSLSSGPSLVPPAVVTSAHSLPNLTSPQTSPASPTPVNTTSPLSLPPNLNNTQPNPNLFFTDSTFANLYLPYGNNLNFDFPSPVNFFPHPPEPFISWATASTQPPPPTTLNNQVPPGNRANNYWDNFRSYSRQNLLSNSGKSNDGLPQRTLLDRYLNTDQPTQHRDQVRVRKEQVNTLNRQALEIDISRGGQVQTEGEGEAACGYQQALAIPNTGDTKVQQQLFAHNLCNEPETRYFSRISNDNEPRIQHSVRLVNENETQPSHSSRATHENEGKAFHPIRINENEVKISIHSARLVNETDKKSPHSTRSLNGNDAKLIHLTRTVGDCGTKSQAFARPLNDSDAKSRAVNEREVHRGANKTELSMSCDRKGSVNKRNQPPNVVSREAKVGQLNNHNESNTESDGGVRPINFVSSECISRPRRNHRTVHSNPESIPNCLGDGHCLMATEKGVRRKDNKGNASKDYKPEIKSGSETLEECVYSEVAALISVNEWRPQFLLQLFKDLRRLSANRDPATQAALSSLHLLATAKEDHHTALGNNNQPVSGPSLEICGQIPRNKDPIQLPSSCAQLDWDVRVILVDLLPFIKVQLAEVCGPQMLEALRKLILQLVPTQSTLVELDAQLEDALHKFHGCRLGDVYEELLSVVADVLTSELTFLRFINTVHQPPEQQECGKEEENSEEGAVGGVVEIPANQTRRSKMETVSLSEADLAEADQSRHTNSGSEEEALGNAEGANQHEEEGGIGGRSDSAVASNSNVAEPDIEVMQDRDHGLDQVPTRLDTEAEANTDHSEPGLV